MVIRLFKAICRRSISAVNALIKKSSWYKSQFLNMSGNDYPTDSWYRKNYERNFDLMVLGSSMPFWGIDIDSIAPMRGIKLSAAPQYLMNDYRLLKNFFSIIRHKGMIIIPLSPFSSVDTEENGLKLMRYLKVYQNLWCMVDPGKLASAEMLANRPHKLGLPALRAGLRVLLGRDKAHSCISKAELEHNSLSDKELREDAKRWIDGWMKQFNISDLSYGLTEDNIFGRERRLSILRKMIDFCRERELRPIIVYMPVSRYLADYFTPRVREIYIDSFLRELDRDVEIFNYLGCEKWQDEALYFNSFFLNKFGRRAFTKQLMKDISSSDSHG